jgi:hypothetical protein
MCTTSALAIFACMCDGTTLHSLVMLHQDWYLTSTTLHVCRRTTRYSVHKVLHVHCCIAVSSCRMSVPVICHCSLSWRRCTWSASYAGESCWVDGHTRPVDIKQYQTHLKPDEAKSMSNTGKKARAVCGSAACNIDITSDPHLPHIGVLCYVQASWLWYKYTFKDPMWRQLRHGC